MGMDLRVLALANAYTDKATQGGGAVKGKNCQIESQTPIEGGTRITFVWYLDDGTAERTIMDVMNGVDGQDGQDGQPGPKGDPGEKGDNGRGIKRAYIDDNDHMIIVYDDDTSQDIGEITVSGGGSTGENITASISVGGIKSGTVIPEGTSYDKIFKDLFNPTAYPTLSNPSATMSATGSRLLEVGSTQNTTITISFNRGSINPAYGTSGYRAGQATGYSLAGGASQQNNTFNVTITSAKTSYQGSVSYAEGEQPKDSVGEDYQTPLPAGSVNTNTLTWEFVLPIWANTSNITTVAKLALVSKSTKVKELTFPAQTTANPEEFHIPSSWVVTAVETLNTLSNQWEDCSEEFTITDTTHQDAAGNTVTYKRYVDNRGYNAGSRKCRVKWS